MISNSKTSLLVSDSALVIVYHNNYVQMLRWHCCLQIQIMNQASLSFAMDRHHPFLPALKVEPICRFVNSAGLLFTFIPLLTFTFVCIRFTFERQPQPTAKNSKCQDVPDFVAATVFHRFPYFSYKTHST